jgi:hypothetical protein
VSAWRTWRTRRAWPVVVASVGAGLVLGGHALDLHAVEWAGILVLVIGGVTEQLRLRNKQSPALVPSL